MALVAFVGGGSLFDVFPNIQPATSRSVTVEAVTIEPSVTMEQYATHSIVVRGMVSYSSDAGSCGTAQERSGQWTVDPKRATEPGIAIQTLIDFSGFVGRCLEVEIVAFNAVSMVRIRDPLEMHGIIQTSKRENDQAGVELWVSERALTEPFVVRVQVFDGDVGHLLTFKDSPAICPPAYLPCPAETPPAPVTPPVDSPSPKP